MSDINDDIKSIKATLDSRGALLTSLDKSVALLASQFEDNHKSNKAFQAAITDLVSKHNDTIYGNGVPGMTTKISNIEKFYLDFKEHTNSDRWGFGVMVSLLVTILGWTVFIK